MGKEIFESRGLQGHEELVESVKIKAGELHDLMGQLFKPNESVRAEAMNCLNQSEICLQEAVMWFVKGVSRS